MTTRSIRFGALVPDPPKPEPEAVNRLIGQQGDRRLKIRDLQNFIEGPVTYCWDDAPYLDTEVAQITAETDEIVQVKQSTGAMKSSLPERSFKGVDITAMRSRLCVASVKPMWAGCYDVLVTCGPSGPLDMPHSIAVYARTPQEAEDVALNEMARRLL